MNPLFDKRTPDRIRPRYFDEVDILTGTPDVDTFEIEPLRWGYYPTDSGRLRGLGRGTEPPKEQPGFEIQWYEKWSLDDDFIQMASIGTAPPKEQPETSEIVVLDDGGRGECNSFGCTWIPFSEPLDDGPVVEEVDILVYQEQERAAYLEEFQAPTTRSYAYIEDFEPIQDEIVVGGNPYVIEIGDNDIPTFTPALWGACGWFCFL